MSPNELVPPSDANISPPCPQPRKRITKRSISGREALRGIAEGGQWNWVLLGPDAKSLPLLGCGTGCVDELRACAQESEDLVTFALVRLGFGVGRLQRFKWAFLHIIGREVPVVKRGKFNAVRPAMEDACDQL